MQRSIVLGFLLAPAIIMPLKALAQPPAGSPMPALYATKAEAEKAAALFHCNGAHQMGDKWMPCARHGDAHSH
jgi:hypothetical protein